MQHVMYTVPIRCLIIREKKNLPHFIGWANIEEGYYTKTALRRDFGVKPLEVDVYDATARLIVNGRWNDYVLYHIDNCIEIKKRQVKEHPITVKAIAEALYLINKSAKVSRDTKQTYYYMGKHQIVQSAKTRQAKLYALKDRVITKLLAEQKIDVKGYHTIVNRQFLLLHLERFIFHIPLNNDISLEQCQQLTTEVTSL